ncbi:response regulator [Aestuariibacter salexigens]|uniref:response regulator n=1 Tax=Aestuariibacter salexigens TaxID=226010 RepID=UPI00047A9343|nr:response regulator [Aestuariibacter salexigens]
MTFPVLICDDSSLAQRMVKKSLPSDFACELHTADNGQQALDLLNNQHFALLFLDLTMPVMDGLEVLHHIKQKCIEVFVIVISGDVQPQMRERVMALGALDFISKPVDESRLTQVLKQFGLY